DSSGPRQDARFMRKGERKRQVLAQAKALMAAQGFGAPTLGQLAEAAGITPGRLGRYFASHADLVRAVVNDLRSDTFPPPAPESDAADASEPPDPPAQLQAPLDRYLAAAPPPTVGFRALLRPLVQPGDPAVRAG